MWTKTVLFFRNGQTTSVRKRLNCKQERYEKHLNHYRKYVTLPNEKNINNFFKPDFFPNFNVDNSHSFSYDIRKEALGDSDNKLTDNETTINKIIELYFD